MNDEETIVEERAFSKDAYDRYCRQIDKEDNLIDQRLNWMLASQSLLFGALGVSDQPIAKLMYLIIPETEGDVRKKVNNSYAAGI